MGAVAASTLRGRTALVTGGGRGIGREIALELARAGADVAINYYDEPERAEQTTTDITAAGVRATAVAGDVGNATDVQRMIDEVVKRLGRLDILVNNAGVARDQLMLRMKRADWDDVLATNLTAAFTIVQAVLKPMIRQRGGRIISIGSVVGQMGNAGQANYAASKAGLVGFSKAIAREVASRQITVNVVAPGLIATDMTQALTDKTQGDWSGQIPLGRIGTPEDVAAAVCFLASDEASYITGQVLAVNGGMYT
jgi:3-oxoacyl-[acyl-carrier protein] reductase